MHTTATVPRPRPRSLGSSASRRRVASCLVPDSGSVSADITCLAFGPYSQYRQRDSKGHREVRKHADRSERRIREFFAACYGPERGPLGCSPSGFLMTRSPRRRRRWLARHRACVVLLSGTAFAVPARSSSKGPISRTTSRRCSTSGCAAASRSGRSSGRPPHSRPWRPGAGCRSRCADVKVWDDCVLSAEITPNDPDEVRTGDPNEDCTPDDRPDPDPASRRKPRKLLIAAPLITAEIDLHALMFGQPRLRVPQPVGPRRRGAARADPRALPAPRLRSHDRQHRHRVLPAHEGGLSRRHLRRLRRRRCSICATSTSSTST